MDNDTEYVFASELMGYIIRELTKDGYDVDYSASVGSKDSGISIDVFLDGIKSCEIIYLTRNITIYYGDEYEDGLYFRGGILNNDFNHELIEINIADVGFLDKLENLIESKVDYVSGR